MTTYADHPVEDLLAEVDPDGTLSPCRLGLLRLGPGAATTVADTVEDLLAQRGTTTARPRVELVVDPVRIDREGRDLKDLVEADLAGRFAVRRTVLDDGQPELHVVDEVVAEATAAVAGVDAVVALGGGTISDVAKLAAAAATAPDGRSPVLVVVMTAASVDGYTDDVSVVLRGGVKRTVPSRWPDAVVADAETVAAAPARMNRAGFGEMTSMLTAPADWYLAGIVGTDRYHEAPMRLLRAVGGDLAACAPGVREADPAAVEVLTEALALRGIATGVSGTTAVLSGVEHLVSHMLDQHRSAHHEPLGLHGAQVGAGAVVAAACWEMLRDRLAAGSAPAVDPAALDRDRARAAVEAAFGHLGAGIAAECWADYGTKLAGLAAGVPRLEAFLASFADHLPTLDRLVRPSAEIAAGLHAAGATTRLTDLEPAVDPALARWAVAHCGLMRNRVTVVDLLTLLGWWGDADVAEVLERAERAVLAAEGVGRRG